MSEPGGVGTRIRTMLVPRSPLQRDVPAFRSLSQANALSLLGGEGYEMTLLMLAAPAYASGLSVGGVGMVLIIPALVAGPLAGAWLDRAGSRRGSVMRGSDLVRAALATGMALCLIRIPGEAAPVYLAAAAITLFDAVFSIAMRAGVSDLVRGPDPDSPRRLNAANSMLEIQTTTAQVLAPPIFVFALQYISPSTVVLLNALTFLASYVLLRRFARAVNAGRSLEAPPDEPGRPRPGLFRLLREGFAAVRRDRMARALLVVYSLTSCVGFALLLSVPQLVADRGLPQLTIGLSFGSLAAGSLLGSRLSRHPALARRPVPVLIGDPLCRASAVTAFVLAPAPATLIAGFFLIGVSAGLANVSRITLIQLRFGPELQGRMMSFYLLAHQIFTPFTPMLLAVVVAAQGFTVAYLSVIAGYALAGLVLAVTSARNREPVRPC